MAELSRLSSSPEMDPVVWSRLPEVILEHVLSFLPLKIFWTLRSTCKHFKSLLFSPEFISRHSSSLSSSPIFSFLLLSHPQFDRKYALYDTSLHAWRTLPLSASPLLSCIPSSSLLASSRGLLCFALTASSSLLVCNVISNSSRVVELPSTPFPFYLLTLVFSPNPNGFKIFALESASGRAFLYHSENQSWRQFDRLDGILDHSHQEGAYFKGCLYFSSPEPFSVISFNLENGNWGRPRIDLPEDLVFGRLLSDGDEKLYLVGGIGRNGISRTMKLWELVGGDNKWVEVTSVPEAMCRKFMAVCYHNYEHVYCFWHEGSICVCCYTWPEILYFRVSRGTWHWLSKCPLLPERWSCGFRWFSLVPNLHAFCF